MAGLRQAVPALANYSLVGIWKVLRRLKLRYKRGREYVHSPDPLYRQKMAYVEAATDLAQTCPDKNVLVYVDELTYYRRPSLASAYARQGHHQAAISLGYRANTHRRIAAALNAQTGQVIARQRATFDRKTFLAFLRSIQAAYPHAQRIFVVMDNWPVHFHPDLLLACQGTPLMLLRLPTYAPWTNPVEDLWRRLKQELLHHHPFDDDWESLKTAVDAWLAQWETPSTDLLHYVGFYPY
ncbi:hypothetical protein ARNL5_01120 [Anaerolineae bacterium]|nr:hypothetical protein ARNL5_01120 [Anaerolineae bacterium]